MISSWFFPSKAIILPEERVVNRSGTGGICKKIVQNLKKSFAKTNLSIIEGQKNGQKGAKMPRRGENIRKRKDGRWEGRYYVQKMENGNSIQCSVYAKSYGEVKEKLSVAKLKKERLEKGKETDIQISFSRVAEEWLAKIRVEKKHATYTKYRMIYEKYLCPKLGNVFFSQWNNDLLTNLFQSKGTAPLSYSLQKSISCVLNQILSYANFHYLVHLSPYALPRFKTDGKPVEVLNQSEQARLLQYLYQEMDIYKLGIVICISTGLRLGELCALKWRDVDLEENLLYINATVQRIAIEGYKAKTILLEGEPKSNFSRREIPLSDELTRLLLSYCHSQGEYVIRGKKPMEPRTYQNKFQKYLQSAGIKKKNFHILRHTFATNCISNGVDIKSLSEILGHSDVKITLNRYVHPTTEVKRQHMNSLSLIYGQLMGQE